MALTTVKSDQIQTSVALAGSPTTTTQSASDNSTKVATTAYVETAVANLVASAPAALNTLDELAAALNDDASFSTTVTNSIATKLPLAGGTLTGDITSSALIHLSSADPIVKFTDTAGGDTFGIFASASDFLGFYNFSDSRTDLVIDGSGNVGIGTDNPTDLLTVGGVASPRIGIQSTSGSGDAGIEFGDDSDDNVGYLVYDHSANAFRFGTNTVERLRIHNNGYVGINTSGATPSHPLEINTSTGGQSDAILITNQNTATNNTAGILFAPSNGIAGARIEALATEDFSTTANRTADLLFYTRKDGTLAEKVRIDSSGNVGIGTDTPSDVLAVYKSSNPGIRVQNSTTGESTSAGFIIQQAGDESYVWNYEPSNLVFGTDNTSQVIINRFGSLSLNASSPIHYTGYAGFDFGNSGTLYSNTTGTNITSLLNNAYLNSSASAWVYKQADEASYLAMMDGKFRFFTAAAGSAGGSITWGDEKMQLSAGGYLGIGTGNTTPRYNLQVKGNSTTAVGIALDNVSGSSTLDIAALGSTYNSHQAGPGEVWFYSPDNINIGGSTGSTNDIKFIANNKVNMRISAAGVVTKSYQPFFIATGSGAAWTTVTSENAWNYGVHNNTASYWSEGSDRGGNFNPSNGRFTAPVTGWYTFQCSLYVRNTNSVSGTYLHPQFFRNGVLAYQNGKSPYKIVQTKTSSNPEYMYVSWSENIFLAATQYVTVNVYFRSQGTWSHYPDYSVFTGGLIS